MLTLTSSTITELTSLQVEYIYLYEVSFSDQEPPLRLAKYSQNISFDSELYLKTAIKHSEIEQGTDGKIKDVVVSVGNTDRVIEKYIQEYQLNGRKVVIKQAFPNTGESIDVPFIIKQVSTQKDVAKITLSMGFDAFKMIVPARRALSRFCQAWQFKDATCRYSGSDTSCTKTFEDCKRKGNLKNFGGFPGLLSDRFYM